ncbi:MerR family transcriptional regulator [Actinomycetes bacterium KLBMP 9759]
MTTRGDVHLSPDFDPDCLPADENGYSISQVAAIVGMSPRNVRAHQARGLLWPPTRRGRTAVYGQHHLDRLRLISKLQSEGFNLTAIQRLLAQRERSGDNAVERVLSSLDIELVAQLQIHGVVSRAPDGTWRVEAPRAIRAALDLRRHGLSSTQALEVLGRLIALLRVVTQDLIELSRRDVESTPGYRCAGDELAVALVALLTESFPVAMHAEPPSPPRLVADRTDHVGSTDSGPTNDGSRVVSARPRATVSPIASARLPGWHGSV